MLRVIDERRILNGPLGSDAGTGTCGAFILPSPEPGWALQLIVSDAIEPEACGWEHVSVCALNDRGRVRTPTWKEMAFVKMMHWDAEDVVVQFHPRQSEYVNCHPHVLHLWRAVGHAMPTPPPELVGPLPEKAMT